jgi:hypothetical protein
MYYKIKSRLLRKQVGFKILTKMKLMGHAAVYAWGHKKRIQYFGSVTLCSKSCDKTGCRLTVIVKYILVK